MQCRSVMSRTRVTKRRRLSGLANLGNCPKMPTVLAGKSDELDLANFLARYLQYFAIHDALDKALSHNQMVSSAAGT